MGERGLNLEPPTERDLAEMRRLTSEAIRAGALGVSTSRNLAHRFRDCKLAPSVSTEEQELQALAGGLRDAAAGVFQMLPNTQLPAEEEFALMRRLVKMFSRPLPFSLLQTVGMPANFDRYAKDMALARCEGLDIDGPVLSPSGGCVDGVGSLLPPLFPEPELS